GGDKRSVRLEREAALGDKTGSVSLPAQVIVELDRFRSKLGLNAQIWVPLHGREQALGVVAEQPGEGGQRRRTATEQQLARAQSPEHVDHAGVRTAGEEGVSVIDLVARHELECGRV